MIGRPRSSSRKRAARRFEQLEKRHLLAAHFIDFRLLEASDYTHTEVLVDMPAARWSSVFALLWTLHRQGAYTNECAGMRHAVLVRHLR